MANLSGEVKLLEEYYKDIDKLFDQMFLPGSKVDTKVQKEIDRKIPLYLKQAQLVRSNFPEALEGPFHESNSHVFRALRLASSSVMARRIAQSDYSFTGVKGLVAGKIADVQERANATKALAILVEGLDVCDTAFARFHKSHFLDALDRKDEAMSELRYIIANFPDDDIYVHARKELDQLENPPKKGLMGQLKGLLKK
jgi:hypothetical protein